jgi:hypothetical protein
MNKCDAYATWSLRLACIICAEGQGRGAAAADEAESGYWDVVYLLYPELAEAAGLGVLHDLVSTWPLIERNLAVR